VTVKRQVSMAPFVLRPRPSPIEQLSNANISTTKTNKKIQNFKQRTPALSRVRIALSRPMGAPTCGVELCFVRPNNALRVVLYLLGNIC
jgi:hypothetical protein